MRSLEKIKFRCPVCSAAANLDATDVTCSACGRKYPLRNGAVDFVGPYQRSAPPPAAKVDAVVDIVLKALSLPADARQSVEDAVLCSTERTGTAYIDAEIATLPSRFGVGNFETAQEAVAATDAVDKRGKGVALLRDFGPPTAPAASAIYRSIRLRAQEALPASSVGVSYRWVPSKQTIWQRLRSGRRRAENPVTSVPIALHAGREFSLPVLIQTPETIGEWRLSLVANVNGRHQPPAYDIPLSIVADRPADTKSGKHFIDYGVDHHEGAQMLIDYLESRPGSLLLEVAAGASPHLVKLADAGHTVIVSDVCSNQMQLGAIFCHYNMQHLAPNLGYASFDAFNAPFQPAQFDGVAMFSALHHFPQPAEFLKALGRLVRPGGFVAALCEPAEPQSVGPEYIRDLEAGINEQVFTVEEYQWMFAQAGLKIEALRNDAGSIKIISSVQ